jgi:hypothetical protein
MKIQQILKFNTSFLLSVAAVTLVPNKLRNPFEFAIEATQEVKNIDTPTESPTELGKWSIKQIDHDFLIIENEGQVRTVRISSFK